MTTPVIKAYSFKEKKTVPIVKNLVIKKYKLKNGNKVSIATGKTKKGNKVAVIVKNEKK
jgi:hypothetical protein